MRHSFSFFARCAALFVLARSVDAAAHGDAASPPVAPPASLAVQARLPAPPKGVTDLKFGEMFAMPVGPRGLEPSAKLRELDGQRVRLVGYMVLGDVTSSHGFLLSPLPVMAGDEDDSMADDIPASAVLVRVDDGKRVALPNIAGLIRLTGVLHVGTTSDDASRRNAAASLELDAACTRALRRAASARAPARMSVRARAAMSTRDTRATTTSD